MTAQPIEQVPAPASPVDWLAGVWRSDRTRTMAAWGDTPPLSSEMQHILSEVLGQLMFKISRRSIATLGLNRHWGRQPCKVIWSQGNRLCLARGKAASLQIIEFLGPDLFRVDAYRFQEYFYRIGPQRRYGRIRKPS